MYFRQFQQAPKDIIQNRKACFGTYTEVSPEIDIKGMIAPYAGIPVPPFITNLRIKGRLHYLFSLDKYIGLVEFFDFKFFGLAEIIFWNKETGKKNAYHTMIGPRKHFIPLTTDKGICASYKKSRYIKISWAKNHRRTALSFRLKGDDARPYAEGLLISPLTDSITSDSLFVNPSPASSRCSATWIHTATVQGQLRLNRENITPSTTGLSMLCLNKTYFKFNTFSVTAWGLGQINDRKISFQLRTSNLDSADDDKYNENILITDGTATALPPVVITHPFGIDKKWIIQDTESMIDLTFTPSSVNTRALNLIVMRTYYNTIYGTYDGTLLDKDGNKITLKGFAGILSRNFLRL